VTAIRKEFDGRAKIFRGECRASSFCLDQGEECTAQRRPSPPAVHIRDPSATVDPFCMRPLWCTGVVLGYAPLGERDIREEIRCLAAALK